MTNSTESYSGGAVSEVAICNKALRYLGASEIVSLRQGTREADLCLQGYAETRNELLSSYHWSFATRYTTLAMIDVQNNQRAANSLASLKPMHGFNYAYRLPADCLVVQRLLGHEAFVVAEQYTLYTNAYPARAALTMMIVDPAMFSSLFIEALSRKLAASMAVALINNARLEQTMMQRFVLAFDAACLADAIQEGQEKNESLADDTWIAAR